MDQVDDFLSFIDQARADNGNETDRAFSLRTTGSPDTVRDVRRYRNLPGRIKLERIADALKVTVDQLLGRAPSTPDAPPRVIEATHAPGVGDVGRTFRRAPQDLPVRGTALGHNQAFGDDGKADVEVTIYEPGEVLHYVARPPALFNNDAAYAIYVQGDSMAPAHKDGALRVVNPRVGIRVGDDVVVQLHASDGDDGQQVVCALIKTLVKRSASFVTLQQLNPPKEFKVPVASIATIHRVMDLADLLG